jgi:hypothetical protein
MFHTHGIVFDGHGVHEAVDLVGRHPDANDVGHAVQDLLGELARSAHPGYRIGALDFRFVRVRQFWGRFHETVSAKIYG